MHSSRMMSTTLPKSRASLQLLKYLKNRKMKMKMPKAPVEIVVSAAVEAALLAAWEDLHEVEALWVGKSTWYLTPIIWTCLEWA